MYKKAPSAIPKNMKNLISPLLKIKIEYKTIIPVIIQNISHLSYSEKNQEKSKGSLIGKIFK